MADTSALSYRRNAAELHRIRGSLAQVLAMLESGEMFIDDIPLDLCQRLKQFFSRIDTPAVPSRTHLRNCDD